MPTTNTRSSLKSRTGSDNGNTGKPSNGKSSKSSNGKNTKSENEKRSKSENGSEQDNSQLKKLFTDSLKDLYWAEKHLTKALPKMKKAATTDELKSAIEEHITQTEEQVSRLEQVFELCGKKAQAKKCDAMEGLIKEGESIVEETEAGSMTRDAGIIMAAQKVEHYEIATYGSLVQFAKTLGMDEAAELLEQTLEEEKGADEKLSEIAEGSINEEARKEDEDQDESEEENEEEK